jgi:hypothetical protein
MIRCRNLCNSAAQQVGCIFVDSRRDLESSGRDICVILFDCDASEHT